MRENCTSGVLTSYADALARGLMLAQLAPMPLRCINFGDNALLEAPRVTAWCFGHAATIHRERAHDRRLTPRPGARRFRRDSPCSANSIRYYNIQQTKLGSGANSCQTTPSCVSTCGTSYDNRRPRLGGGRRFDTACEDQIDGMRQISGQMGLHRVSMPPPTQPCAPSDGLIS